MKNFALVFAGIFFGLALAVDMFVPMFGQLIAFALTGFAGISFLLAFPPENNRKR